MLCDECHIRPVALRIQVVAGGNLIERNLCTECGQKYSPSFTISNATVPLQLLGNVLAQTTAQPVAPAGPLICPWCNYPYERFQQTSMLGCARCYESFSPQMEIVLRRAQGGVLQHAGKVPSNHGGSLATHRKIDRLRRAIQDAVAAERYEDAARFRDQIKALQESLGSDGSST